nr:unnamed protein product [Digitaria exilis]
MTRITAPPPPSSPPGSPPPIRHSPAPATPPSLRRGRHSPSPSLALTPSSSASTSAATSSRPKRRSTPKRAYAPAQWVPLSSHPAFSRRDGEGGGGGGAAWDAAASRLYAWDPSACGAHRIGVRIRDPEAESDGEEVAVEAAVPSEMLMPETDLGYLITHVSLNSDGSSLLLVGSHNLSILYVHDRVSEDGDTVICRTAPIASQILSSNGDGIKVLQASWHPFSNNHFAVLTSDAVFRLFDLSSDLEQPEQEFYLQPILPGRCQNASAICPVSFSYGSDHLWDRFSVFIELKEHADYVKTELEDKQKRLEAVKKSLLSIETKDQDINTRIDRAFKVYELLEKRIDSFKMLPAANKKPLSQAEQEFKAQLDRFADVELDALRSSIAALSARMKRFAQQSTAGAAGTGVIPWQAPKVGRSHISESQMSLLKSSLEKLSLLNEENNQKLRIIDHELKNKEQ